MGRGALTFKGESPKKKKKKSKHRSHASELKDGSFSKIAPAGMPADASASATASKTPGAAQPKMRKGTGRITTSGTVVTGHDSLFMKEINVGDAILVNQEMRVVTMRLSDISINLSSPFSQNYATPVVFHFISKPRQGPGETAKAEAKEKATMEEQHAFDIYKGGGDASGNSGTNELVYREKTEHGSYRIKRVKVDGSKDRTNLLEMRTKKKSDKYC